MHDFIYCDSDRKEHFNSLGFKEPSDDQYPHHRRHGFQLVLRFAREPEGSADSLSPGMTEIVWVWLNFSMIFLSKSASDEAVGHHAIIHSQGPCHVEMVWSSHLTRGRSSASLFRGFFQSSQSGHSDRG